MILPARAARTGVNAYGGSVPTSITRAQLTTDIVLAGVFALICLPFAVLGGWPDLVVLVVFATALAVRRLSPAWSLGIAWVAALAADADAARPAALRRRGARRALLTAAHGRPLVKWLGLASAASAHSSRPVYLAVVKPLAGAAFVGPTDPIGMLTMSGILFVASIAVLVLAWTNGLLVRSVRDTREIKRREEVATRERELVEYRYVVEQERNRIARDMHDVVAHSLAVVIAQADGARFAARTDPRRRPQGSARSRVSRAGRSATFACCWPSSATPNRFAPAGARRPRRVARAGARRRPRRAFTESGERLPLGTGNQIAVYRIVQEGLTNALRHGDVEAPVELEFAWDGTAST